MFLTGFIFNVEFRAMIGWCLHTPLVRQQTIQFVGSLCACNNKGDIKKVLKFSGLFRRSKSVIKFATCSLFHLGNFRKEFWKPTLGIYENYQKQKLSQQIEPLRFNQIEALKIKPLNQIKALIIEPLIFKQTKALIIKPPSLNQINN